MNSTPFQPSRNESVYAPSFQQTGYPHSQPTSSAAAAPQASHTSAPMSTATATADTEAEPKSRPAPEVNSKMTIQLNKFNQVWDSIRSGFRQADNFEARCQQAFDIANDLFGHAPTWICFYRGLLGGSGMINMIFTDNDEYGRFLRSDQYHQIQMMLTALRSRDLPENDPNDPQRMITVRLPKSLHEAMCEEAGRLNISVNRLCISRMLQLLDPKMIPETHSKPRGRKPRTRSNQTQQ